MREDRETTVNLPSDDPRHGTLNGYSNLRCRCEACEEAGRLYCAKHKAKRLIPSNVKHGVRSTYNHWACRCGPCRAANTAYQRRHRERKQQIKDAAS